MELPGNDGVIVKFSVHAVQLRPSPPYPTGQALHVETVAQLTPAKQNQVIPQPAGGGGFGGGGAGDGGNGGAAIVATVGDVVSATPVVGTPAAINAA